MTSEEIFFFGVLIILLLRILFRKSQFIEGYISCSGLRMYDYETTNDDVEIKNDVGVNDYDTTIIDDKAAAGYKIPERTCVDGEDGDWEYSQCSVNCGSGKQHLKFTRYDSRPKDYCVPPKCNPRTQACVTNCNDYSADSCQPPSSK